MIRMSSPIDVALLRSAYQHAAKDLEALRPAYLSKDGSSPDVQQAWTVLHARFLVALRAYLAGLEALTDSTPPIDSSRT